jgi:hypothetical protein
MIRSSLNLLWLTSPPFGSFVFLLENGLYSFVATFQGARQLKQGRLFAQISKSWLNAATLPCS